MGCAAGDKAIRHVADWLRHSIRKDDVAIRLGGDEFLVIVQNANENQLSLWEVISNINEFGAGRAVGNIHEFSNLIKRFEIEIQKKDAYEASNLIAKESGLLRELYEDKTIEGLNRYENVQELLNAIKEFVDNEENEDKSLSSFLQSVALITNLDEDDKEEGSSEKDHPFAQ